MNVQIIPSWTIALLAWGAALAIFSIKRMPILIRISLMIPKIYFGILYIAISIIPFEQVLKSDLVRAGLAGIFIVIIFNALLAFWAYKRGINI